MTPIIEKIDEMKQTMKSHHLFDFRTWGAAVIAGATVGLLVGIAGVAQAATAVDLGTAASFVVLAGAGVTNTGATTLNGDLGTFPTTSITGSGTLTITGTNHAGDAVTQGAKDDLTTAYLAAEGQGPTTPVSVELGGRTLTAGVYNSASELGLTGTLTLDGGENPNAVFVFQAGSTLITASNSQVLLTGGAQACNVFWQVGSSATLGTASTFRGTILALSDITVTTGTTIQGRVLARNGAVTLDTNVITAPVCTTPSVTPPDTTVPGTTVPDVVGPDTAAPGTAVPVAGAPGTSTGPQVTTTPRGGVQTGDGSTAGISGAALYRVASLFANRITVSALVPTQWRWSCRG